jgi:type II secretory pathway component PulK
VSQKTCLASRRSLGQPLLRQQGYVLLFVMAALAMLALIVGRFAIRIDALREQTSTLSGYARARLEAGNAAAAALYWISTQQVGPAGFGPSLQPSLRADDRPYLLGTGAEIRVQDSRGLYPLNALQRETFAKLLRLSGADANAIDAYTDVLLDYQDTDDLKRLNGAERVDYGQLGLPKPRNDWLLSVRELGRMPRWRDHPELVAAIEPFVSTNRVGLFNPNTAPRRMLEAMLPQARPEQIELLETLRTATPFMSGFSAAKAIGLGFKADEHWFHGGAEYRLTVWAPGMPQALQYNVALLPGGAFSPWLIAEVHSVARPAPSKVQDRVAPFPMALASAQP